MSRGSCPHLSLCSWNRLDFPYGTSGPSTPRGLLSFLRAPPKGKVLTPEQCSFLRPQDMVAQWFSSATWRWGREERQTASLTVSMGPSRARQSQVQRC